MKREALCYFPASLLSSRDLITESRSGDLMWPQLIRDRQTSPPQEHDFAALLFFFKYSQPRHARRCCPHFCLFEFPLTCPRSDVFTFDPVTVKCLPFSSHSHTSPRSLCFSLSPLLSSSHLRTLRCSPAATNKPDHSASKKKDLVSFVSRQHKSCSEHECSLRSSVHLSGCMDVSEQS